MVRIVYILLIVLLVITGLIFAVLNAEPVQLNYYFASKAVPLSLVLLLAIIIGAVLGILASASLILTNKRQIASLRKSVELAEKEIANLRAIPIRDKH